MILWRFLKVNIDTKVTLKTNLMLNLALRKIELKVEITKFSTYPFPSPRQPRSYSYCIIFTNFLKEPEFVDELTKLSTFIEEASEIILMLESI